MDKTTRTGYWPLLAQSGAAALVGVALPGLLARLATVQGDAGGGAASPTPVTAAPPADCAGQEQAQQNLARMDRLDFEGWNNRDWALFRQLHGDQVKVAGFGQQTEGIDDHVAWAQAYIAQHPDSKIVAHPIRIGAGDWTVVTGRFNDGTTMCTLAHWENGRIAEEYLFSLSA